MRLHHAQHGPRLQVVGDGQFQQHHFLQQSRRAILQALAAGSAERRWRVLQGAGVADQFQMLGLHEVEVGHGAAVHVGQGVLQTGEGGEQGGLGGAIGALVVCGSWP